MFYWRILRRIVAGVMCSVGVFANAAAQSNAVTGAETVHIEVSLQGNSGDPAPPLSARNFTVQQGGKNYPIQVTRPSESKSATQVETHVLMLVRSYTMLTSSSKSLLEKMMARGWQVGVLQSDGTAMYSNDLAKFLSAAQTSSSQTTAQMAAIQQLATFPGHRVLIADKSYVSVANIATAHRLIAEIYRIATSTVPPASSPANQNQEIVQFSNIHQSDIHSGSTPADAEAERLAAQPSTQNSPGTQSGIWPAKDVSQAMTTSLTNAGRYYDLSFSATPNDMQRPVELTYKGLTKVPAIKVAIYALPANGSGNIPRLEVPHSPVLIQK